MTTVFRPYSQSDALRSDRSAGDRLRHRQKVRNAIRDNVADIIAEESIIGQDHDRIIKVPIRGVREYRFVYGRNSPGVSTGQGDSKPGQTVGQVSQGEGGLGHAGDRSGVDYYETEITLEELIEIMFEDLELPDMEHRRFREVWSERASKRRGFRRVGVRAHMDKRRTAKARIRRRLASGKSMAEDSKSEWRFPFHRDDMRYHRLREEPRPQSNAVVLCIMDTSGSMDTLKKYLARSFFFLLYQFVRSRYINVDVVFIAHHTKAREVTEEEFFHKGESGGTFISSGYKKALEIIQDRYHPSLWNIYAFHCSDGDNFDSDNAATLKATEELCEACNLFGYGEIKPRPSGFYEGTMLDLFRNVRADNFQPVLIQRKEDIWPSFKQLLSREHAGSSGQK
ncbi:MAG: YeaH/YhbH family protein [Candidatus Nitrosoglobus sp.]|jgi:sporulation protein YhbH